MEMACFFVACLGGNSSDMFVYAQADIQQGGFLVLLPIGISSVFTSADQHEVVSKADFARVQSILCAAVLLGSRLRQLYWGGAPNFGL